jgi:hypothetical protein
MAEHQMYTVFLETDMDVENVYSGFNFKYESDIWPFIEAARLAENLDSIQVCVDGKRAHYEEKVKIIEGMEEIPDTLHGDDALAFSRKFKIFRSWDVVWKFASGEQKNVKILFTASPVDDSMPYDLIFREYTKG